MTHNAQLVKTALAVELAKQGRSLDDFEKVLADSELHKEAAYEDAGKLVEGLKGILNIAGGTAIGAGLLGGAGLYGGYRANADSTDLQLKKRREELQYIEAARALQEKLQNNQVL